MSRTYTERVGVPVQITDAEGYETGRTVTVILDVVVDVDASYGADAYGHRGQLSVETYVIDETIDYEDLMTMDSGQVERALKDAKIKFEHAPFHHTGG